MDGLTLYMNYVTKLMSAGFKYNAELTVDEKEAYSKECVINGETKTIKFHESRLNHAFYNLNK